MSGHRGAADGSNTPPPETDGTDGSASAGSNDGGSALRKWGKRVAIGLVALVGLIVVLYLLGVVGVPSAGVEDMGDWGEVSEEETEIVTTVWVDNPNPVGLSLGNSVTVDYDIQMNDVLLAEGSKSDISIPAGNSTRTITTDLYNNRLDDWWVGYIRADETVSVQANASVTVDALLSTSREFPIEQTMLEDETPVIDALSASVNATAGPYTENVSAGSVDDGALDGSGLDGPLGGSGNETLTVGYEVQRGWATWKSVNATTTTIQVHVELHNPGDVPVPAEPDGVGFTTEANGVEMFAADSGDLSTDTAEEEPLIQPGETRTTQFTLAMANDNVDDWFTSHVRNGERTRLATQFQLVFREPTTEQTFRIPDGTGAGHDCTFQTAILVDDQTASSDCQPPEEPAAP